MMIPRYLEGGPSNLWAIFHSIKGLPSQDQRTWVLLPMIGHLFYSWCSCTVTFVSHPWFRCMHAWFHHFESSRRIKKVWHLQLHQIDDGCNDCWGHLQTFWLLRSKQLCPRSLTNLTKKRVSAFQCIWLGGEAARSQFGDGCVPELSGWLRIYDSHHTSVMLDLHVGITYSTWGYLGVSTWIWYPLETNMAIFVHVVVTVAPTHG